jgi:hypothetical protein
VRPNPALPREAGPTGRPRRVGAPRRSRRHHRLQPQPRQARGSFPSSSRLAAFRERCPTSRRRVQSRCGKTTELPRATRVASGLTGSRGSRIHTSCAVLLAPVLDRAFARWCFTVECDRPSGWAAAFSDPATRTAATTPISRSVAAPTGSRAEQARSLTPAAGPARATHHGRRSGPCRLLTRVQHPSDARPSRTWRAAQHRDCLWAPGGWYRTEARCRARWASTTTCSMAARSKMSPLLQARQEGEQTSRSSRSSPLV